MKISYNWLNEYVAHELSADELAEALTMSGLEVDSVEQVGSPLEGVVVGRVVEVHEHPNADRLVLCQVDLGDGEPVQIACGAPNVAAGQKVPVATVGTTLMLPDRNNPVEKTPVEITARSIRGERSNGMICAEDELGLSEDHSGIMVLPEETSTGRPFVEYLAERGVQPQDTVLDIEITPNRPDATSHLGVARDVAALTDQQLVKPAVDLPSRGGATAEQVTVHLEAPDACPRYAAMLIRDVTVGVSPAWLKRRLEAIGLRPRNNVVDVTNFVLHECGQPLHAFDRDRLAGDEIHVRLSEREQTFTTLDGQERSLPEDTLLICDADGPVAVAGIMGGANSEVTAETTDVLLESAYFDPSTVRRTAKALQVQTDSSYRFERGVDPQGQVWTAARAAALIAELTGGEVVPGLVDEQERAVKPRVVPLRLGRLEQVLGLHIPEERVVNLLEAIGFEVQEENPLEVFAEHAMQGRELDVDEEELTLQCTVPTFRPDIDGEVDVIEEVARLHGYDQIPEPAYAAVPSRAPRTTPADILRRRTRGLLNGLGYREIYTNSLLRQDRAERFNVPALSHSAETGPVVETMNPISQEMAAMRPSLLPGMLQVMQFNQNHGQRVLRFMEFGHVYRQSDSPMVVVPGYAEHENLILGMSGPRAHVNWDVDEQPIDFFDLKGVVELLVDKLCLQDVTMEPQSGGAAITAYHLQVQSEDVVLGTVARLADEVADDFDLQAPCFFAELNWERLVQMAAPQIEHRYRPVSRFPVVERDLAVVVKADQAAGALLDTIRAAGEPLLQEVSIFDLYEGEHVAEDEKSLAFRLRFGADRTLKDEEVDERIDAILKALEKQHRAELRQ